MNEVNEIDYLHPGWRCTGKGPNPANKSGFHATGHRILVEPIEVEKKTASGIVLVDKTVDAEEQRSVVVRVLEIGPDAWRDKSTDYCKVGDKILIGMYVGKFHTSPTDGKKYRFISDLDVITPITEAE
jgi:co-chaperonin GroES (HSP10)